VFNKAKPFPVREDALDSFANPPLVSIPDILVSPKKRRVSVLGLIKEVSSTADVWRNIFCFVSFLNIKREKES